MYGKRQYRKDHYRFVEAFKHMAGKEFSTNQIDKIMLHKFGIPKGNARPNDHAKGNKDECKCARTKDKIFDRIRIGLYKVRPNL